MEKYKQPFSIIKGTPYTKKEDIDSLLHVPYIPLTATNGSVTGTYATSYNVSYQKTVFAFYIYGIDGDLLKVCDDYLYDNNHDIVIEVSRVEHLGLPSASNLIDEELYKWNDIFSKLVGTILFYDSNEKILKPISKEEYDILSDIL